MSTKLPGYLKIKAFWSKGYNITISTYNVIYKILSHDSNNIADVVMWLKLDNSGISMREVTRTSVLDGFDQKYFSFEWWGFWFKFNNLELARGITLKCYISVAKGLKLKFRKFWRLITTFGEASGEKSWHGGILLPILSRVKNCNFEIFSQSNTQSSRREMSLRDLHQMSIEKDITETSQKHL